MIKRSHIRQFLAVVEEGSFTAAASRIRVTQPTLSAGIAELERLVGTPLFLRERKRIRMTEAGARLLPIARELEQNFRAADALGLSEPKQWPTLKLGLLRSISGPMTQRMIAALTPDYGMEIIEGTDFELRSSLASGRIDFAVTLHHAGESGESAMPLLTEPYAMIIPSDHRFAGTSSVAPEHLASEVMIARRSCELLRETSRFFTRHGVRPRFSLRSDNDDRCMRMVAAGLGITTAPVSFLVADTCIINVAGYDFSRTLALVSDNFRRCEPAHAEIQHRLARQLRERLES